MGVLSLIWGSSFILMKHALYSFQGDELYSPLQVGCMRMFIAAMALLPFTAKHLKLLFGKDAKWFVMVGVFGNAIPAMLFPTSETHISSALAGMLNALTPIFTLLIGMAIFRRRPLPWQTGGILVGLVGAVLLVSTGGVAFGNAGSWPFALLVVIACLCYGISLNVIQQHLTQYPSVLITGIALLMVGPVLGIYLVSGTDFISKLSTLPGAKAGLGFATILAVGGTAGALVLYNQLIKKSGVLLASSVTYVIPFVAIGWGLLDGESITGLQIMAGVVTLSGIWLINRK